MARERTFGGIWGEPIFLPATTIGRKLGTPLNSGTPVMPEAVEWGGRFRRTQMFHGAKTEWLRDRTVRSPEARTP
jgi:hypothetical protein